jgi:hypothetical protein
MLIAAAGSALLYFVDLKWYLSAAVGIGFYFLLCGIACLAPKCIRSKTTSYYMKREMEFNRIKQ